MSNAADVATKPSEPEKVDSYMAKLDHPLKNVVGAVRELIFKHRPGDRRGNKMQYADFFLHRGNAAVRS
jgi:hypothetical protein